MELRRVAVPALVVAVVLLVLDAVWLVTVASPLYRSELGSGIAESPDLLAGALFYLLYVAALTYFAVLPGVDAESWRRAAGNGAFLGLTAYGTWALTNKAVLADWPVSLVPVDMAWGALLSAVSAVAAVAVVRRREPRGGAA